MLRRIIASVPPRSARGIARILMAAILAAAALPLHAQVPETSLPPAKGEYEHTLPPGPPDNPYAIPDLPPRSQLAPDQSGDWLTWSFILSALYDYTALNQDTDAESQVGKVDNQGEVRDLRLVLHGTMGHDYKVGYYWAASYKGFDNAPGTTWALDDASLSFPLATPATSLTVGKTKETFGYEVIGDAASLAQQERVMNFWTVSRSTGAKVTQVVGDAQFMTISAGVFNDGWGKGKTEGYDYTGRVSGLLWDKDDGKSFMHVAIAARYSEATDGVIRYAGRPETNIGPNYIDTGKLPANHSTAVALEALWNQGPYSILSEYTHARVDSPATGNPQFGGYYVLGSWVLTGETRPYDRTVGYDRRIIPTGRWGAFELVARFSHENLDDGTVHGGEYDKTYVGLNWWATTRWKFGAGWGHIWLDRYGKTGNTDDFLTRLQWIF